MSSDSPQMNFNAKNQQVQVGNNNTQTQNINEAGSDWRPPFVELAEQVSDKQWPEETSQVVKGRYEVPSLAVKAAVEEIENDLAVETTDIDPVEFEERKKTWTETFQAMVPMGIKVTSSVGMALAGHFTKKTAAGVAAEAFFSTISEINSQ